MKFSSTVLQAAVLVGRIFGQAGIKDEDGKIETFLPWRPKPKEVKAFRELPSKTKRKMINTAPIRTFRLSQLVTAQPGVRRDTILHYLGQAEELDKPHEGTWGKEIAAVGITSKGLFLLDGNHRTCVKLLTGRKTIKGRAVDLRGLKPNAASSSTPNPRRRTR